MLHNDSPSDTEALIKQAAKKIFLQKGLSGTRLQEIADAAGIGRTALHYYFRSKEKLFQVVFTEAFAEMHKRMCAVENNDLPILDQIKLFITTYFEMVVKEPDVDIFLINEFNQNTETMTKLMLNKFGDEEEFDLLANIEEAVKRKEMVGDPYQIFITIISVCMHPFAAKKMLQTLMEIPEEQYMQLMERRKDFVIGFLEKAFTP